jgi:hypothetical protein
MSWSSDGQTWSPFPPEKPAAPYVKIVNEFEAVELTAEVTGLIERGAGWPIATALWQEAWRLCWSALRSSVVIGVAAVEVAVKEFVASAAPSAAWLAAHSPSPPTLQMLSHYLPTLTAWGPRPPARIRGLLRKGIELRNEIVHRGRDVPFVSGWRREEGLRLRLARSAVAHLRYVRRRPITS